MHGFYIYISFYAKNVCVTYFEFFIFFKNFISKRYKEEKEKTLHQFVVSIVSFLFPLVFRIL